MSVTLLKERVAKRRKKRFNPEDQYILITAPASYPRRWQGIRSERPLEKQIKGTMFEPKPENTQMDLFGGMEPKEILESRK